MRRILLICPTFPPTNFISSRRAAAFAKYLSRLSWDVRVLTASLQECSYGSLASPEESKLIGGIDDSCVIRADPLPPRRRHAFRTGAVHLVLPGSRNHKLYRAMLRKLPMLAHRPDIVWATYPTPANLLTASWIARMWRVPWIVDFRDVPNQFIWVPTPLRWIATRRLEQLSRTASIWTTVSEPMRLAFRKRFHDRVRIIPNGYDPELYKSAPPTQSHDVFRIIMTGSSWPGKNLMPIVRAAYELMSEGLVPPGRMQIVIYGSARRDFLDCTSERALDSIVQFMPFVSASEVVAVQKGATVLLSLSVCGAKGVVTGKLPEYLGVGRPILSYPKDPSGIDPILQATGMGASCDSVNELKAVLQRWYFEWEEKGDIVLAPQEPEIEKWSRQIQADALASLCTGILERQSDKPACRNGSR